MSPAPALHTAPGRPGKGVPGLSRLHLTRTYRLSSSLTVAASGILTLAHHSCIQDGQTGQRMLQQTHLSSEPRFFRETEPTGKT